METFSLAIMFDLNNTLLRSDKIISEYTIDILKKCQSKGVKVAFAIARSEQGSLRFLKEFVSDIFIGYGGPEKWEKDLTTISLRLIDNFL